MLLASKSLVEIDKKNLIHNFREFKKYSGKKVKVAAVVKANAYGHGLKEVVSVLKNETDFFIVDNSEEALAVKSVSKNSKILIIGYVPLKNTPVLVKQRISFSVFDLDFLKKIVKLRINFKIKIHIKIETGLNRLGFNSADLVRAIEIIKKNKDAISLEGIYTHLANVEDTKDPSFTYGQLAKFDKAVEYLRGEGFDPKYIHAEATGASFLYPNFHYTTVRAGIGVYGLWPSEENKRLILRKYKEMDLKPVLSWKSVVAQVKNLEKGDSVGYGRTWISHGKTRIAIIPIGYSDGYDRGLTNCGRVIIKEKYRKIVGRIAMNMFMVEIGLNDNIKTGDIVILIGKDGTCEVSADEIAEKIGTINYEVVCRVNGSLPRKII